jgi:hypothetical protein
VQISDKFKIPTLYEEEFNWFAFGQVSTSKFVSCEQKWGHVLSIWLMGQAKDYFKERESIVTSVQTAENLLF